MLQKQDEILLHNFYYFYIYYTLRCKESGKKAKAYNQWHTINTIK